MGRLHRTWHAFSADESGQDLIEYALVVALIALGAITTMKALAATIGNFWMQFIMKVAAIWPA